MEVEVERLEYGRAGVRVILKNSSAVGFTGVNHPTPPCACKKKSGFWHSGLFKLLEFWNFAELTKDSRQPFKHLAFCSSTLAVKRRPVVGNCPAARCAGDQSPFSSTAVCHKKKTKMKVISTDVALNYGRCADVMGGGAPHPHRQATARPPLTRCGRPLNLFLAMSFFAGAWRQRTRDMWRPLHYFYIFLMYIHLYPAKDNFPDALSQITVSSNGKKGWWLIRSGRSFHRIRFIESPHSCQGNYYYIERP